ncbi:glucuronate isomerase [Spongiimicrobium sp. 2-473A-2-J]|uniref:glucuronate isomerase n=1 Tax=Eudoraea algarum TaxID=3417568 RepID=UPI003D362AFB
MGKIPSFINENFLLHNRFAEELYHEYAKGLPIIDYHCHLSPAAIANNRNFTNITEAWIAGDHYKWRAMRTLGIPEKYITGNASDEAKFKKWAEAIPYTLRNPLFHWTHLELARYFGIRELLHAGNAAAIYRNTTAQLAASENSCQGLLRRMGVEVVCTTEDPIDDLKHHQHLASSDFEIKVGTSFRPDKAIHISDEGFNDYMEDLGETEDTEIDSYDALCEVLAKRIAYFNANGCKLADHGLENISFETAPHHKVVAVFDKRRSGKALKKKEIRQFTSAIMLFLSEKYHEYGWVQQFHLGALRNNNSRMLHALGPDTGWDSIGDFQQAKGLSAFLDALDRNNKLAKTILYNINPSDNEVLASMIGNFNDGSVKGKVQFGPGWWFLDQKEGMTNQLNALSNIGLVSCFIGMLTDSRSFLSFPRHEYFRRILCNLLGKEMEMGELPQDINLVGSIVKDISYYNAKKYFEFD